MSEITTRRIIFNLDKLPEYTKAFADKKIAVIGAGAVGSLVVESLLKMGCRDIVIIDLDVLEADNIAKSSSLYRYPDDVGCSKAIALARRANEILTNKTVNGIYASISDFGPMAFAGYDVVILALDNFAAKVYFNQIWKQMPDHSRPLLISGGTYEESGQSYCFDGEDACLRCSFDEKWLRNPLERTSCLNIQYRVEPDTGEIVRTSGLASGVTAHMIAEQCRSYFLGNRNITNKCLMYEPYPNISISEYTTMKRKHCPDCMDYHPMDDAEVIKSGDVLHTTVGEFMRILDDLYDGQNYELMIPVIEYANIGYTGLIKSAHCSYCGSEIDGIYRHSFRTVPEDIVCDFCRSMSPFTTLSYYNAHGGDDGVVIRAITHDNTDEILANKTLYEIGFPLGAIIEVRSVNDDGVDIIDFDPDVRHFYCENDTKLLKTISRLEA